MKDEQELFRDDVVYMPCEFCGSDDYDFSEGSLDEENVYKPKTCDVCGFGFTCPSKITVH